MTSAAAPGVRPNTVMAARPRGRRWGRIALAVAAAVLIPCVITVRWWGPRALSQLDYFHVHRIRIDGLRFATRDELVRTLGVDTMQSVWQNLAPLAEKVATHPMVAHATVARRLPGTLVLDVVERIPVALVRGVGALQPVDVTGAALPIDPSRVSIDAPIIPSADTVLLTLLDRLRVQAPAMYARVTEAQRMPWGELRVMLGAVTVRANPEVTVARFLDILPVEADLARNQLRAVALDLRFREQVIARQP